MDLSIIIVSFNSIDLINNCIRSIYRYLGDPAGCSDINKYPESEGKRGLSWEIIIADNCSRDGSVEFIRGKISEMKDNAISLIELDKNYGFAGAANCASENAKGKYLLFMNPDCELIERGFKNVIDFLEKKGKGQKAGAVGTKILNTDGSVQYSCRVFPRLEFQLYDAFFLPKLCKNSKNYGKYFMTWWDHSFTMQVDWVSGAFLLIKSAVFKKAGRFNEAYFMYSEDAELCLSLVKKGYANYYYADYKVKHSDGAVALRNMALREAQVWKSRKIYFSRNHGWLRGQVLSILYFKYTMNRLIAYYLLFILNFRGQKRFYKNQAAICSEAIKLYFKGI